MNVGKAAMGTFAAAYVVGAGTTIALAANQPRGSEAKFKVQETAFKVGAVGAAASLGVAGLGIASSKLGINSLRFANSAPVMLGVALLGGAAIGGLAGSLYGS